MADEIEELEGLEEDKKSIINERFKTVSRKVTEERKRGDAEAEEKKKALEEKVIAQKETAFYKEFSKSISKYPQSSEFEEQIKERVLKGYTVEDATVAALNSAGKLILPKVEKENPAGGSAVTQTPKGDKPINEMSPEEKRAKLKELIG